MLETGDEKPKKLRDQHEFSVYYRKPIAKSRISTPKSSLTTFDPKDKFKVFLRRRLKPNELLYIRNIIKGYSVRRNIGPLRFCKRKFQLEKSYQPTQITKQFTYESGFFSETTNIFSSKPLKNPTSSSFIKRTIELRTFTGLKQIKRTALRSLSLDFAISRYELGIISRILRRKKKLEVLRLAFRFGPEALSLPGDLFRASLACSTTIRHFSLKITENKKNLPKPWCLKEMEYIANFILRMTSLESLELSIDVDEIDRPTEYYQALLRCVEGLGNLKRLSIQIPRFSESNGHPLAELERYFSKMKTLESLDFNYIKRSDSIKPFMAALATIPNLRKLGLLIGSTNHYSYKLTEEDFQSLVDAVGSLNLEKLSLSIEDLDYDIELQILLDLISQANSLKELELSWIIPNLTLYPAVFRAVENLPLLERLSFQESANGLLGSENRYSITNAIKNMTKLKTLSIQFRESYFASTILVSIAQGFRGLKSLENLSITLIGCVYFLESDALAIINGLPNLGRTLQELVLDFGNANVSSDTISSVAQIFSKLKELRSLSLFNAETRNQKSELIKIKVAALSLNHLISLKFFE